MPRRPGSACSATSTGWAASPNGWGPDKTSKPPATSRRLPEDRPDSDRADVQRLVPLPARADVEFDLLSFLQRPVAGALDLRVVDKNVRPRLAGDETEALLSVEELHRACSQRILFSLPGPIRTTDPQSILPRCRPSLLRWGADEDRRRVGYLQLPSLHAPQ